MEISIKDSGGAVAIALSGRLTYADAPQFDSVLAPLRKQGIKQVAFDLGRLEFIDSTGMSLFIHAYDLARDADCPIRMTNAKDKVLASLQRAGFDKLVSME